MSELGVSDDSGNFARMPRYEPLERLKVLRPVDRISYLRHVCIGRRVVDLGAMDETSFQSKKGRGAWLHEELADVADFVLGVDASTSVPPEGLVTGSNAYIVRATVDRLKDVLIQRCFVPDIVVGGELIEHLDNPLAFLRQLASEPLLAGKQLLLTTPNATAVHNVLIGIGGCESTHHDHLSILSYKTLCTLLYRAGFRQWRLVPYQGRFTEIAERHRGWKRAGVRIAERGVNSIEWLFPMLSFGWIVDARIPMQLPAEECPE